ncbi:phosphotransferase family protein [Candidatus Actinomarina]|nr:phosphotransferase family protein [Candidatus Actinomarina sp.]
MLESSKVVDIFLKYDVSKTSDSNKYKLTKLEGITNNSFIVEVDDKKFVLRIPGENPDVINRESEKHNTLMVQEQGLTLPFIVFDHESGIKISEYFELYTYKESDFKDSVLRNNAFKELEKLHNSGIIFQNNFKPTEVFMNIADNSNPLEKEAKEVGLLVVKNLNEIGLNEKPCHQDLYPGNFVVFKDKTFLIDWEYSSMGDSYFDYADLFSQNNFEIDKDLKNKSLDELGISTREELEKFEYFEILSMITWGLWALRRSINDNDGKISLNKALEKINNKKL